MTKRGLVRSTINAGLLGGFVVVYLAAVGMIGSFSIRNLIGDQVTLGRVLMALPAFLTGYLVARPRLRGGIVERIGGRKAVLAGLGAGALTGAITAFALALAKVPSEETVRNMFVAVTPALLKIMTFGKGLPVATILLILAGGALGGVGASLQILPKVYRRPLNVALIATFLMGLLQELVPPIMIELARKLGSGSPETVSHWLYSSQFGGLTRLGAVIVFVVALGASVAWAGRGRKVRDHVQSMAQGSRGVLMGTGGVALLAVLFVLPILVGEVVSLVLGTVGIFLLMGLGLNIVVGYAGLLDLGYVAFFAVGAYMTGVLTATGDSGSSLHPQLPFLVAIPLVMLAAAFTGLLIGAPVLRLRGDYLAIVTLGFGEIARVLAVSDLLKKYLGGPLGLYHIPQHFLGLGFNDPEKFFYLVMAFVLLALYVSWRLARSRIGRAWNAMREDEQVAEAMGISTVKYKLLAFALGAAIGCLSGALFAVQIGSLEPNGFNVIVSITALSVIILGGMGSIPGVVVGALVLIGIPNLLDEFEAYRLLIYGAVLVGIMILRPQGLIPNIRRSRELLDEEREQDQWGGSASDGVRSGIAAGTVQESE
ncbi:MAG: branched-chain amino acid ABC transporter permease [Actinobacteria bacterium]|nr:MAG: branched-chain amino acid ABC transporter permease [Actinomycetota bacterium]